jgi:hypothetical protein
MNNHNRMRQVMKNISIILTVLMPLLLVTLATPAFAQNWRFLKYSPISYFDDEDWRLLRETGADALSNQADGATLSWQNPATGNSGELTPLNTFQQDGLNCRQLKIVNNGGGQTGTSTFKFCRTAAGEWKQVP